MHMQGTPPTMQQHPTYDDVVAEVSGFLEARLQAAAESGIAGDRVVLDPGIGFGKTTRAQLGLAGAHLEELQRLGRPVCLGVSRKGFLGRRAGPAGGAALAASLAAACHALDAGGPDLPGPRRGRDARRGGRVAAPLQM